MAIRSGGPRPPATPSGPAEPARAKGAEVQPKKTPERSDGFDSKGRTGAGARSVAARPTRPQGAVIHSAISSLGEQIETLEKEASRLKELMAAGAFSGESIGRIGKKLDRIRAQMEAAKRKLNKYRRALIESGANLDKAPDVDLPAVESALERLERYSSGWARALEAMELAPELDQPKRRVSPKGANRRAALDYAESANAVTALADLATASSRIHESPAAVESDADPELGATLNAVRRLERIMTVQSPIVRSQKIAADEPETEGDDDGSDEALSFGDPD